MNDLECGEYLFSSNFDSGNLRKVELVRSCAEIETSEHVIHVEFDLWTSPDCYGTPYENPNRTWFFFSIKGGQSFRNIKLNIRNLNRQAKLFSQGMQPVMRIGENGKWERIKDKPIYATESDCFYISFIHRTNDTPNIPIYYAFTYPFTYTENLTMLDKFDRKYGKKLEDVEYIINRIAYFEKDEKESGIKKVESTKTVGVTKLITKDPVSTGSVDESNSASPTNLETCVASDSTSSNLTESFYEKMTKRDLQNEIYYHRELLVESLEKRRIELLTISSFHHIQNELEERLVNLFPRADIPRCRSFKDKKIIFMSSRVHPGETAASFVLNGFLNLITDRKSLIGQTLRQMYVFKVVPFLNPDGVYNGLYRTDTLGQNLNRMYICPQLDQQPSIYAVKKLIKYYHMGYDGFDEDNNKLDPIELKRNLTPVKQIVDRKDEMCSTASLFDFVEKLRTDGIEEVVDPHQICSSKEITSSEGEEISGAATVQSPAMNNRTEGAIFTNKLISEIKTVVQTPLANKLSSTSSFNKKSADHLGRKNVAFKTVFSSNHGGISRSNEIKLKDLPSNTMHRPKLKKVFTRKEGNGGNSTNCTLKGMNKRNLLCCQSIDISSEHFMKCGSAVDRSNLFLYMDFHGHASKKGIFMYGNHFQSTHEAVECMLLPRLMGINCHHFHYDACNFSERNMYRREKRDGLSKEGSGRVAVFKMTGLIKCYTLESNYNTGKYVNTLPNRNKEFCQKPQLITPPKYAPAIYEEVGRALGPSILDITSSNTISRIFNSEYRSIQALRIAIRNEIERHGSQRPIQNTGKVLSSQQDVRRVKRSSLNAASTSNDVPKENKATHHNSMPSWELAIPSSSTQNSAMSVLQSLNQPSKISQKPARCIKRNPLKVHSTNLYGKKDATVNKKKPKSVILLESSCSTSKKDCGFPIPPKKVRVSPTHSANHHSKEPSPPERKKCGESNLSEVGYNGIGADNVVTIESSSLMNIVPPVGNLDSHARSEYSSHIFAKADKMCQIPNSASMAQFYSAGDVSLLKKCTSDPGLDIFADSGNDPSSSATFRSSTIVNDAEASCSPRLIVRSGSTKRILTSFRKTKKTDNFLLKSAVGGVVSSLTPKMKNTFGSSENCKLGRKKRSSRHDALTVKRKKSKAKMTRH